MAEHKVTITVDSNMSRKKLINELNELIENKLTDVIFDIHNGDDNYGRYQSLLTERKMLESIQIS